MKFKRPPRLWNCWWWWDKQACLFPKENLSWYLWARNQFDKSSAGWKVTSLSVWQCRSCDEPHPHSSPRNFGRTQKSFAAEEVAFCNYYYWALHGLNVEKLSFLPTLLHYSNINPPIWNHNSNTGLQHCRRKTEIWNLNSKCKQFTVRHFFSSHLHLFIVEEENDNVWKQKQSNCQWQYKRHAANIWNIIKAFECSIQIQRCCQQSWIKPPVIQYPAVSFNLFSKSNAILKLATSWTIFDQGVPWFAIPSLKAGNPAGVGCSYTCNNTCIWMGFRARIQITCNYVCYKIKY